MRNANLFAMALALAGGTGIGRPAQPMFVIDRKRTKRPERVISESMRREIAEHNAAVDQRKAEKW